MVESGIQLEKLLADVPAERDQLRAKLDLLETHLAARGPFVVGAQPSVADFALYHLASSFGNERHIICVP